MKEIDRSREMHTRKGTLKVSVLLGVILAAVLLLQVNKGTAYAAAPELNARVLHMHPGQTFNLKLSKGKGVSWKSSDRKVAVVKAGRVKAVGEGTAIITAKRGRKNYKCEVTVARGDRKALIIYFSATGTTKKAAERIQKIADADIVRLIPKITYKKSNLNYDKNCRANREQNKNSMVPVATVIKDLRKYDTIYLGYPIWWGKEPGVIRTFLSKNSLKGKKVLPFCTSGGSGISGSMPHIRNMAKGASVGEGADLTDASDNEILEWIS